VAIFKSLLPFAFRLRESNTRAPQAVASTLVHIPRCQRRPSSAIRANYAYHQRLQNLPICVKSMHRTHMQVDVNNPPPEQRQGLPSQAQNITTVSSNISQRSTEAILRQPSARWAFYRHRVGGGVYSATTSKSLKHAAYSSSATTKTSRGRSWGFERHSTGRERKRPTTLTTDTTSLTSSTFLTSLKS